jgi:hypothetical protein
MFHNDQLAAALVFDHQTRLRATASRRRLTGRNKLPPAEAPPTDAQSVVWTEDATLVLSPQRAHCAA